MQRDRRPGAGASARAREDSRTGYLLISPTVVIVFAMVVLPDPVDHLPGLPERPAAQPAHAPGFIGDYSLDNFTNVLTSPGFLDALVTTLVYSVAGTACAIGLGLVAALALRAPFRGRGLVRACMLVPYVAPVVAATFVWTTMLNPQFGIVNHYGTTLLGWDEPIAFLSSGEPISVFGLDLHVSTSLLTVVLFEGWRSFPFAFLFLTARMQAIPEYARGGGDRRRRDPDASASATSCCRSCCPRSRCSPCCGSSGRSTTSTTSTCSPAVAPAPRSSPSGSTTT